LGSRVFAVFVGLKSSFLEDVIAFGTDPNNFIATFSNVGPEINWTVSGGRIVLIVRGYGSCTGLRWSPAVVGVSVPLLAGPREQGHSDTSAAALRQYQETRVPSPNWRGTVCLSSEPSECPRKKSIR
jgi:hypothetical protein